MIAPADLARFAPNCDAATMAPALDAAATEFGLDTPQRLGHWLAQLHVESGGFTRLVESLNYSAERLVAVWPVRFPNLIAAQPFAHNPQKLAERVYGGRASLGNTEAGDGARFIGRGLIQTTGRANYARTGLLLGLDLLNHPDQLETPAVAARAAGAFWSDHHLNTLADRDDVVGITHTINGGLTGLSDRQAQVQRAKAIWA